MAGGLYISSYYILLLLMIPAIVPLTQNIGISILQAKNKHKFRSVVYVCIAILNIFISIPLAKEYGGVGAAIGTAIANLIGQISIMNYYYWKKIGIDIPTYWKRFISYIFPLTIVSLGIRYLIRGIEFNFLTLVLAIIGFTIIYSGYAFLFMNDEEKGYFRKLK